jgi:hypothetical protein
MIGTTHNPSSSHISNGAVPLKALAPAARHNAPTAALRIILEQL